MSTVRVFRWGDPEIPVGVMAAVGEPRAWVMVCAPGWKPHVVSWVDRVEVLMDDGSRVLAGNDKPIPGGPHGGA
ncbi:MAG: hypothetical protein AMXMBFR53_36370 [Gemmatimonadota bacterium]